MATIAIVGSGPNLGLAVARRFAREGWHCVLIGRNLATLDAQVTAVEADGHAATARQCDVTDFVALDRLLRKDALFAELQFLNYNAARIRRATLLEQPLETIEPDLMTNVGGAMVAARAVLPGMRERGQGTIIFSGGQLAFTPWHDYLSLGVGKAALRNLAQGLVRDPYCAGLRIANVTINAAISPTAAQDIADLYWRYHAGLEADNGGDLFYSAAH